jgi:hypothetical protein
VGTCPAGQSGTPTIGCNSLGWAQASLVGTCVAGTGRYRTAIQGGDRLPVLGVQLGAVLLCRHNMRGCWPCLMNLTLVATLDSQAPHDSLVVSQGLPCLPVCCCVCSVCSPPYPSLINGRWPDSCLNTPSGQNCTAQCNAGYGPGATVKCTAGAWEAVEGACNRGESAQDNQRAQGRGGV